MATSNNVSWPQGCYTSWGPTENSQAVPRNVAYIDNLKLNPKLQPREYQIHVSNKDSKILFKDVQILKSTGRQPYQGDVLIEGERITHVGNVPRKEELVSDSGVTVFHGRGRTLMSGLGDAHAHLTWNGGDLARLGDLPVEEHVLLTIKSAKSFLDSGYTMCFGAAAAKDRLDVVIRDAINSGDIPGPRYLGNAREIAKPEGDLVASITRFADGPEEMRQVVRSNIECIGVDNVKISMSGEEITGNRAAEDCYFTAAETAACVEEAHLHGKRVCAHARARDSVKMCVRHGVDVIFHASYVDDEGMEMLENNRHTSIVAPAINWLVATAYEAEEFGYTHEAAEKAGYVRELDTAVAGLREMHRRGIVILPGGDYGFAWTPHGTYARDL
ncbi:isoaspartyl dipeptidase-like protein [Colletotrichum camelliae]|nr:isoaspartyl dipeptidase-like protein [Colletotrichum camelliae]